MQTSNFWHYSTGGNRIVIARAVPRGIVEAWHCSS